MIQTKSRAQRGGPYSWGEMDLQRFGREREEAQKRALTSQRSIAALQEIKKSHPHAIQPLQ